MLPVPIRNGDTYKPRPRRARIAKNGGTIPVWLTASLLRGSDGKPSGVVTTEREPKGDARGN